MCIFTVQMLQRLLWIVLVLIVSNSCVKDPALKKPETPPADTSRYIQFKFNARCSGKNLLCNSNSWYNNLQGDSFTVLKFQYFISNITFIKNDGTSLTLANEYHLLKHQINKTQFTLQQATKGSYTAVEFLIGVDSLRNISGAQSGDLDPGNDMFWDWTTGYIFYKLEGQYKNSATQPAREYAVHIGGFQGRYSCLRKVRVLFNSILEINKPGITQIIFNVDVDELFKTPYSIGFDDYYNAVTLPMFQNLSYNYSDMFSVNEIISP